MLPKSAILLSCVVCSHFLPVTRHISETVQDTIIVTSWLISIGFLLSTDRNISTDLPKGTPEIFGRNKGVLLIYRVSHSYLLLGSECK